MLFSRVKSVMGNNKISANILQCALADNDNNDCVRALSYVCSIAQIQQWASIRGYSGFSYCQLALPLMVQLLLSPSSTSPFILILCHLSIAIQLFFLSLFLVRSNGDTQ